MEDLPPGVQLLTTLIGHSGGVQRLSWNHDGTRLASTSVDYACCIWDPIHATQVASLKEVDGYVFDSSWSPADDKLAVACSAGHISIWDAQTFSLISQLEGHHNNVLTVDWHPVDAVIASGGWDMTVYIWDLTTHTPIHILKGHKGEVVMARWSPSGKILATASGDRTVRLWTRDGETISVLDDHRDRVLCLAFSPDGQLLASGSGDRLVRVWEVSSGRLLTIFEGHTAAVTSVSFSSNGELLASKSRDNTVRLLGVKIVDQLCVINELASSTFYPGIAFHPFDMILATLNNGDLDIRIWEIGQSLVQQGRINPGSVTYCNAKVAIVGEPSVGKTALGLVLSGHRYRPTDSTHNRNVWTVAIEEHEIGPGVSATRELLLWDLAGQPGYRLLHQLHLKDVSVAVLVFDARSTSDPFESIRYWVAAFRASCKQWGRKLLPTFILVSARQDVGTVAISSARIDTEMKRLGIGQYYETSAKTGLNIAGLKGAIIEAIRWEDVPIISSTTLLLRVRDFILAEKETTNVLVPESELVRIVLGKLADRKVQATHVIMCLDQLEAMGLICRFQHAKSVLLRPELIDSYCGAILQGAQADPTGGGAIAEAKIMQVIHSYVPLPDRCSDPKQESWIADAAIDVLCENDVALRQNTDQGMFIVFPAQLTREPPRESTAALPAVAWKLSGALLNIYATLAVRLGHSGLFLSERLWSGLSCFECRNGAMCFVSLGRLSDYDGEIALSFTGHVPHELQDIIEGFISRHLTSNAVEGSVKRFCSVKCKTCAFMFPRGAAEERERRGYRQIMCPICDTPSVIPSAAPIDKELYARKGHGLDNTLSPTSATTKGAPDAVDVFISYNRGDSIVIDELREALRERGVTTWVDRHDTRPFESYHSQLQDVITSVKAAAICLGARGVGKWQEREIAALLEESHRRPLRLGVVLLPEFVSGDSIPVFLKSIQHISLDEVDEDSVDKLVWGVTGERPRRHE